MAWMDVHLYLANSTAQKWLDRAEDALSTLESQVSFPIYTYDEGSVSVNIGYSQSGMLDSWENYIESNNIPVDQYELHLLVVDSTRPGAGAVRGGALGPQGGTQIANSEGVAGFVNAATRYNAACYSGQPVYKPTVIHETGHCALHNGMSFPGGGEHSVGAVQSDSDDSVTPMQIWYTGDPCSGNSPPTDNCNSRPSEYSEGTTTNLTSCAVNSMNSYMNSF